LPELDIRYTTDGSKPGTGDQKYTQPLEVPGGTTVSARAFLDQQPYGSVTSFDLLGHKALGCTIETARPCADRYNGGGPDALVNGIRGSNEFRDGNWQGFEARDLETVIDLGESTTIRRIGLGCLQQANSWIFMPLRVDYAVSVDGADFVSIGRVDNSTSPKEADVVLDEFTLEFEPTEIRYLRVIAINRNTCPEWHYAAGGAAWIFVDEIIVE